MNMIIIIMIMNILEYEKHLKVNTLGRYSDLYNIQEVLILADVFSGPVCHITEPGLAWDGCVKTDQYQIVTYKRL